ncbi:hypothetical protein C5S39_11110 [Candidatus Methanophagaceae archaeon]|nr:hypothetical protein C5S39_11110 [Methanophagales archaeon]
MYYLRIGACADGVVIGFVCYKRECVVKGYVTPIGLVALPGCCYVQSRVPYSYVFGMATCSGAGICVNLLHGDCV